MLDIAMEFSLTFLAEGNWLSHVHADGQTRWAKLSSVHQLSNAHLSTKALIAVGFILSFKLQRPQVIEKKLNAHEIRITHLFLLFQESSSYSRLNIMFIVSGCI